MSYSKLSILDFGTHLLQTNELDPVYVALAGNVDWDRNLLRRWLIAYWCFYDCGVASFMAEHEGSAFWKMMMIAAKNEVPPPVTDRWRRGSERRHFRGQQAVKAIDELASRYPHRPEAMVAGIAEQAPSYIDVAKAVKEHRGFGNWISFKVADMIDRVLGEHVDFTEAAVFMFKDPVQAAMMLWRETMKLPANAKPKDKNAVIHQVVESLEVAFKEFKAPPQYDRVVGLQEIETILCCWKSHMNGHYPLFNDIDEIRERTEPWAKISPVAEQFLNHMPEGSHGT